MEKHRFSDKKYTGYCKRDGGIPEVSAKLVKAGFKLKEVSERGDKATYINSHGVELEVVYYDCVIPWTGEVTSYVEKLILPIEITFHGSTSKIDFEIPSHLLDVSDSSLDVTLGCSFNIGI